MTKGGAISTILYLRCAVSVSRSRAAPTGAFQKHEKRYQKEAYSSSKKVFFVGLLQL